LKLYRVPIKELADTEHQPRINLEGLLAIAPDKRQK